MKSTPASSSPRKHDLLVLLVLCAGLLLSVLAWLSTRNLVADRMQNDFLMRSTNLRQTLQRELASTTSLLETHAPLLVHADTLIHEDFVRVARHILDNRPELQALEWVPRVTHDQRQRFESLVQAEGFPGFRFTDRDASGRSVPVGRREVYFPILYVEPQAGNEAAHGLATGPPMRSTIIQRAMMGGVTAASNLVNLVQDSKPGNGILIFHPVFREFEVPANPEDRPKHMLGLLEGVFRADVLLAASLKGSALGGLEVALFNLPSGYAGHSHPQDRYGCIRHQMQKLRIEPEDDCWQHTVELGGQKLMLVIRPTQSFLDSYPHGSKWLMLAFGLVFTVVTSLFLRVLLHRNRAIGEQVRLQTADLLAVNTELTQSLATQQALRAETQMLAESVRSSREGICVSTADNVIRYVNPAFERMFGITLEQIQGKPESLVLPDRQLLRERGELKGDDSLLSGEVMLRRNVGRAFLAAISCNRVQLEDNRLHTITVVRDVSERRALEKQLANSQKMEALGQLAGGVAHDFNNILTAIHGSCQLLLIRLGESPLRNLVTDIMRTGERAATLVSQLLEFGRPRDRRREPVDLNEIATDLCHMLERLIPRSISLEFTGDPGLHSVLADRTQIEQVLLNLVLNARDAISETGTIRIRTSMVRYGSDGVPVPPGMEEGDYVRLVVADTGMGIPPEIQEKIFEPFFTTKKQKGNGLGLATVYNIVRVGCKGNILLDSRPGQGAEFTVDLPAAGAPAVVHEVDNSTHAGRSILVVEDEKEVRELVGQVLRNAGYTTDLADSAEMALQILNEARKTFDLMVTDIVMPGMNGTELGQRVNTLHPGMKILYMSAYTNESFSSGDAISRDEFLQKPFLPSVLTGRVNRLLESGNTPPLS